VNWDEERFVKVFTRDTPTWLAWPWQARALAPLLMRKLEPDGRLAVGRLEPARAVALTVGLPIEVVEVGLPAMLEDGTLELKPDGLWWPKYEEAQESRKSEALRSREYRAKQRRDSSTPTRHAPSHGEHARSATGSVVASRRQSSDPSSGGSSGVSDAEVADSSTPTRHAPSRAVTPRHPPEQNRTEQRSSPRKKPRAAEPADPRYQPMVERLMASYVEVVGTAYFFGGSCGQSLKALLKVADDDEIDRRWRRGLTAGPYDAKCATLLQLRARWNELAVERGPDRAAPFQPPLEHLG
jgi:hypothetical protein